MSFQPILCYFQVYFTHLVFHHTFSQFSNECHTSRQTSYTTPECDDSMTHETSSCPTCSPVTLLFLEQVSVMIDVSNVKDNTFSGNPNVVNRSYELPFLTHLYLVYHPNEEHCILNHFMVRYSTYKFEVVTRVH